MIDPNASILTGQGRFVVGCNYWASHAGTAMWRDWRPEAIEQDFQALSAAGLQVLRVFPLWPDFQPLNLLLTGEGQPMEIRHGEQPLPATEAGRAGVSSEMMERFQAFADKAGEYGLKLVVGLITGWMSGRLFVPPAFEGRNVLTDPLAIQWETRFVRYFVRNFKDHDAIIAWDLGNECNCMAPVPSREAAWAWTSAITNAIRVEDPLRPVVSGMHSLEPSRKSPWTMQDQGELTDLLTTHPYPIFTPHCDRDPIDTIRSILHAAAESRFYADIGGKPCIAEELGTLGPMIASEAVAADFARSALFSLWAHDCHGLLWWCAFDQLHLEHAPYDWHAFERELGLFRADRSPKAVLSEIGEFGNWLKTLPFERLPAHPVEAVCILTEEQDTWAAAYSSFVLAQQAGFEITFQHARQPLRPAQLYLLPSVRGGGALPRRLWLELLRRVEQEGASLYLSHDDCFLSPFNEPFGLEVQTRSRRSGELAPLIFDHGGQRLICAAPFRLELKTTRAKILGAEPDGNPVFTCADYGKGKMYFLSAPVERWLSETPDSFSASQSWPFWRLYRTIGEPLLKQRGLRKDNPQVGLSEHPLGADALLAILINYSPEEQAVELDPAPGWKIQEVYYGEAPVGAQSPCRLVIPKNDAVVFRLVINQDAGSAGDFAK
jgi:hypothetical protein